jgi:NADH-quinone oxidoreductase subunit C
VPDVSPDGITIDRPDPALFPDLAAALGDAALEAVSAPDMDELSLLPAGLLAAIGVLQKRGFDYLLDLGATDHLPLTPRFEVSYHLLTMGAGRAVPLRFRLRVFPDDTEPAVPSLCAVFPNADWAEREVWDLFGIRFDGHPDLRRILMPDDWKGHPLRKDYPLRGLERRFNPGGLPGSVPPVVTK